MSEDNASTSPIESEAPKTVPQPQASAPLHDADGWEVIVAELTAALQADAPHPPSNAMLPPSLPASLAERLVTHGERVVAQSAKVANVAQDAVDSAAVALPSPPVEPIATATTAGVLALDARTARRIGGKSAWAWSGWLATAAVLMLWAASARRTIPATSVASVTPAMAVSALRDSLLRTDSLVAALAWTSTKDASAIGAGGDVVWSARAQKGVMRLIGLQANDRTRWQYQLWIFDKRRDQRYPVDGGVFDVPAGAREVFVPVTATVPVGDAVMFAITVEKAGGVVVSTRERIALLANAGG